MRRPGGIRTFTCQLAVGFQSLGHEVKGFHAFVEGVGEDSLPELGMVRGPEEFQPDILHLQHCLPAFSALLAFPGVPAVFHCHGGTWRDAAFHHPRIHRYLVMSTFQAERLSIEQGIPPEKISVFLNPVDADRLRPDPPIEAREPAILVYHGRIAGDDPIVDVIKMAAARRGIRVDFSGSGFGSSVLSPETLLPTYPMVFASGISAIEAMASGCAVIVFGSGGCGEMVGSENFDRLRARNFSIPLNCPRATTGTVGAALDSFDPADAAKVTARIREEAGLIPAVERLAETYRDVLTTAAGVPSDPQGEKMALARFLRHMAPMVAVWDASRVRGTSAKEEQG
jgi:glycosyltransferase involved in cell wall biosynthesis